MTYPKIKPCPKCGDEVTVYKYDSGWQHVECDNCLYFGPGEGNRLQAIRSHNARCDEARAALTEDAAS